MTRFEKDPMPEVFRFPDCGSFVRHMESGRIARVKKPITTSHLAGCEIVFADGTEAMVPGHDLATDVPLEDKLQYERECVPAARF